MSFRVPFILAIFCAILVDGTLGYSSHPSPWQHREPAGGGTSDRRILRPHHHHRRADPRQNHPAVDSARWKTSSGKTDDGVSSWSRHAILDKSAGSSRIHLFWNADANEETLTFEIQAEVNGWVGVGFSPNGGMAGSDVVTCWVKDGVPTLQDRHALKNGLPELDSSQDYTLISASENETHTICRFSRKVDTCDLEDDFLITSDTVRIIFAYGESDPENEDPFYHERSRGTTSIYLLDPPTGVQEPNSETTKYVDVLTPNTTIHGHKDTTYICSIHQEVTVDTEHQYIGYIPVVQPGNEVYVHHALYYECSPENDDEIEELGAGVGTSVDCYGEDIPQIWRSRCKAVYIAWAIGSEGQMYPEDVGYPIKTAAEGPRFYMLEMHYNNPNLDTFADNSGFRIYYTDDIRIHEMGVLQTGLAVTPFQMIPPEQKSFTSVAICPASCTESGLPEDGINVFAGILHSHLLGRKMKLRLVRNGVEEPWFQHDDHYDFDFQETRVFPKIKKILPGDILILECTLDSSKRTTTTIGGVRTDDEMCIAFLSHYPRVELTHCGTFYNRTLLQSIIGFPDVFQDPTNSQIMVNDTTTFAEFLDAKYGPWDDQATLNTFRDIASAKMSPMTFCRNEETGEDLVEPEVVGYPQMVEYRLPKRDCPSGGMLSKPVQFVNLLLLTTLPYAAKVLSSF